MEAGHTEHFWTAISFYLPGGRAAWSPTAGETVYVVLDGELTVVTADGEHVLRRYDSIHLPPGTERAVENRASSPATLLVTIATH
jgi:mannose-6-phosphate isomerase-like protein (cupin superfamily)